MLKKLMNSVAPSKVLAMFMGGTMAVVPGPSVFAQSNPSNRSTATPIQHLIIVFQENVSFDHYFGTYPNALNPAGEPAFTARPAHRQ